MNLISNTSNFEEDPLCLKVQRKFYEFLTTFKDASNPSRSDILFYKKQADEMHRRKGSTLFINFNHLSEFSSDFDLKQAVYLEFYRFNPYLHRALHQFLFKMFSDIKSENYNLAFYNMNRERIRDLKTNRIGKLMCISGTVTRTTEVRPELIQGAFVCMTCSREVKGIEQQFKYTEPRMCPNPNCGNRNKWQLQVESSQFCDFQKLRVQENSTDIPPGGMPRSVDIILRNEMVDKAKPGERCSFIGTLIVVPELYSMLKPGEKAQLNLRNVTSKNKNQASMDGITGLKTLGVRDLNYKLVFLANYVESVDSPFDLTNSLNEVEGEDKNDPEYINKMFTDDVLYDIKNMISQSNIYERLSKCIAPSVYGHDEIKKGILLMLLGGVNKDTKEGMKIRGDINVCIVGDPSTAKSQFLKFVCSFLPRSVYTSGKASSAAGLTASVLRDPESGEFCIEAGALMLADNGVCCIDEFDKMDIKDQVAIHEAMEQQTISIAKAGIQATLNARTSILAAANPIYGRYDRTKSLKNNLDMSAPIMSRFDLFFVVLDQCEEYYDFSIANHIVNLHRNKENAIEAEFKLEQVQNYIRYAQSLKPQLTKEAAEALKEAYISLRMSDATSQKTSYRITVRQLESLIRLSEALARVHCHLEITVNHVREAARLLNNSILKVERPDVVFADRDMGIEEERTMETYNIIEEELLARKNEEKKRDAIIKITNDEYQKFAKTILHYFVQETKKASRLSEDPNQEFGILQSDICNFYCQNAWDIVDNIDELNHVAKICHLVINRLITKEQLLIIIRDDPDFKNRLLALHPNYDPEL